MPGNKRILGVVAAMSLVMAACAANTTSPSVETTEPETTTTTHQHTTLTVVDSTVPDDHDDDHEDHEDANHDDPNGDVRTVEIIMTEFAFAPASVEVSAGETVRFVLINDGVVPHEFRLSNEHRIEEHLAAGHEDHDDGGHHAEEGGDVFIEVLPGASDELTFTFPADMTLYTNIACLIEGHHEAGMHGELTYKEA